MVLKFSRTIATLTRNFTGASKLAGDRVIILLFFQTAYYPIYTIAPKFKYILQNLVQRF